MLSVQFSLQQVYHLLRADWKRVLQDSEASVAECVCVCVNKQQHMENNV